MGGVDRGTLGGEGPSRSTEIGRVALLRDEGPRCASCESNGATNRGAARGEAQPSTPAEHTTSRRARRPGCKTVLSRCATCQRLFNEGGTAAPDLTHRQRQDASSCSSALGSGGRRPKGRTSSVRRRDSDGRVLTGLIGEQKARGHHPCEDARGTAGTGSRAQVERLEESRNVADARGGLQEFKHGQHPRPFSYLQGQGQ